MSKIGVALAGCGVKDGSEIHEAVLTLLALSKAGAQYVCMAPNIEQANVINHLTGHVSPSEKRNVLVESARIARGEIQDMKNVKAADLDGLVFPGGYGAVKNLSDFAAKSENASANPESARLVREMVKAGKPVAFLCIAPAVCAAIFRGSDMHAELTIGSDAQTASRLEKMGARHRECTVGNFILDSKLNILSTPAYMLARNIAEASEGIEKTVQKLLELCAQRKKV